MLFAKDGPSVHWPTPVEEDGGSALSTDQRVDIIARMLVESTSSVLELSLSASEEELDVLLSEWKLMLRNYLAEYVSA